MPRPRRRRWVGREPAISFFKPAGMPLNQLEEVIITMEEVEALRLADLESLSQTESAEKMKISQPTFYRILSSARKKISDALIHGKAIRIEGGDYIKY